jgi:hypothetical protein
MYIGLMKWTQLFQNLINGEPEAIQTILSILGFIVGLIGTVLVVLSFRKQVKINKEQHELNRLSMEKNRREIRPRFKIIDESIKCSNGMATYQVRLTHAWAFNISVFTKTDGTSDIRSTHREWDTEDLPVTYSHLNLMLEPGARYIILQEINFHDEDKRQYHQEIRYNGQTVYITLPEYVKK